MESGLLDASREDVEVVGSSGTSRVEIELWFRETVAQREVARLDVEAVLADAGATIVTSAVIESIDYHAILADIPLHQVEMVLASGPDSIELLTGFCGGTGSDVGLDFRNFWSDGRHPEIAVHVDTKRLGRARSLQD